jgi:hypothetical protein
MLEILQLLHNLSIQYFTSTKKIRPEGPWGKDKNIGSQSLSYLSYITFYIGVDSLYCQSKSKDNAEDENNEDTSRFTSP